MTHPGSNPLRRILAWLDHKVFGEPARQKAEQLRRRQVIWDTDTPPTFQEIRERLRRTYRPRGIDDVGRYEPEDPAQVEAIRKLEHEFDEEQGP